MITFGRDPTKLIGEAQKTLKPGENKTVIALVTADPLDFAVIDVRQNGSTPLFTCGSDVQEPNNTRWNIDRVDEIKYDLTKDSVRHATLKMLGKHKEIGLDEQIAQAIIAKIMA